MAALALVAFALVTVGAIALLLTRLPVWPSSRLLLTPLAAQHRLTRLDDDSRGWETALAGELVWLAHRGALRIHETEDAGAAQRITDAGYRAPRSTGWEIEWLGADPLLPAWSSAVIDACFPGGRRARGNRARVDRTGADDSARRAAMKSAVVAELDRARVDRTDRDGWVSRLLASPYSRAFAGLLIVPIGLLLLTPWLPAWAVPIFLVALAAVVVLTFIRPPLQRRWTKLWERYRTESQHLHELPLDERGTGATRIVYLDAFAENLGFADLVAYGSSEDMARGYAQQADAMVREGLLHDIRPEWLLPARERPTQKHLTDLIDGFLFTVR
ncbi:hypothetical protein [Pseudoclavibacter terrae]|uniref:DUF2207 domain-containing protein n=1 Tax=Pseudoclavibacter terrae TaxID=1530195 RepID=A0A7J5B0N7_9MICO|nr:hypothetical protein [Pseudoclavibacter terrae]KAB1637481.1 hypothetical protein F8O03_09620 [Pseudoclavibacter terrae]